MYILRYTAARACMQKKFLAFRLRFQPHQMTLCVMALQVRARATSEKSSHHTRASDCKDHQVDDGQDTARGHAQGHPKSNYPADHGFGASSKTVLLIKEKTEFSMRANLREKYTYVWRVCEPRAQRAYALFVSRLRHVVGFCVARRWSRVIYSVVVPTVICHTCIYPQFAGPRVSLCALQTSPALPTISTYHVVTGGKPCGRAAGRGQVFRSERGCLASLPDPSFCPHYPKCAAPSGRDYAAGGRGYCARHALLAREGQPSSGAYPARYWPVRSVKCFFVTNNGYSSIPEFGDFGAISGWALNVNCQNCRRGVPCDPCSFCCATSDPALNTFLNHKNQNISPAQYSRRVHPFVYAPASPSLPPLARLSES